MTCIRSRSSARPHGPIPISSISRLNRINPGCRASQSDEGNAPEVVRRTLLPRVPQGRERVVCIRNYRGEEWREDQEGRKRHYSGPRVWRTTTEWIQRTQRHTWGICECNAGSVHGFAGNRSDGPRRYHIRSWSSSRPILECGLSAARLLRLRRNQLRPIPKRHPTCSARWSNNWDCACKKRRRVEVMVIDKIEKPSSN
jgi:hypothetical protein